MSSRHPGQPQGQPSPHQTLADAVVQARAWLDASTHVLIGAGAGLSAAAGVDYADEVSFARLFPALVRKGFRARYELIGYDDWTPAEHWGYWATHVHDVRFMEREAPVYSQLRELVRGKNSFVVTSNVDALFARNGFDEAHIYTPQGDYAHMHCCQPCSPEVWPSEPMIKRILGVTDPATLTVTDPGAIPRCPRCGGPVFMNVRLDVSFSDEPYCVQRKRANAWLANIGEEPLLVLEIGAGFNTPGVVRWPMERIAEAIPQARFVRINLTDPEVPPTLGSRAIGLGVDARAAVATLHDGGSAISSGRSGG